MKTMAKLLVTMIFIMAILPFAIASGCYYDPNGGVTGCRSVNTWGSYDSSIKASTLSYAKSNPGDRFMAWCPSQNSVPFVRSDSKLSTCGCPSEAAFKNDLEPGECETKKCANCGNYVSYCKPGVPAKCGDGTVNQQSEQCDDGNSNNNDACTNTCKSARCGDGNVWTGHEECEFDSQCNDGNSGTMDICSSCECKFLPTCQNECSAGEKKCSGNQIFECGNFDTDSCLEWNFKTDCSYHIEGQPDFKCESGSSAEYKENKDGFCNDLPGNNDNCDSRSEIVRVSSYYCGDSACTQGNQCIGDDIFSIKTCGGSCNQNTGRCITGSEDKTLVKSCGSDNCISHTNLDPFVFEYVDDNSGCSVGNNPSCGLDQSFYDMCIPGTDTVLQPYCNGKDHLFQEFDCNSKDGCYDFTYTGCVKCSDSEGNCITKNCTLTGKEYRDYTCGAGKCEFTAEMQDIDSDKRDDRCDSCIDVDKDGVCDEKDSCPGVSNKNQIDTDKDGVGDECDNDRDGDGYGATIDCNDWNAKVYPGAIEIEGNDIDDDCNPYTKDTTADTPQQVFFVDMSMSDVAKSGEDYQFVVTVLNMADTSLSDVQITAAFPGYQITDAKYVGKIKRGNSVSRIFTFKIPKNKVRYEYLRVTVSNDIYKRVIYKEIKIVTDK